MKQLICPDGDKPGDRAVRNRHQHPNRRIGDLLRPPHGQLGTRKRVAVLREDVRQSQDRTRPLHPDDGADIGRNSVTQHRHDATLDRGTGACGLSLSVVSPRHGRVTVAYHG
ncbi:hypothetical protein [Actinoplanes sp. G11-F43]|uniref:hypothetical protein n=1 Tax=Actinoplanes sp. G11-F43 TaxID=3424130 RepID=UPI003D34A30E